jgi:hypothetical protein
LYGCHVGFLTLREKYRLSVFENRVLGKIFWPKKDKVPGMWRRLRKEELYDMYSSSNIIRVVKPRLIRWLRHVTRMGDGRGVYRVLVRRPEGKKALERQRRRWEDNIKMDFKEVEWQAWAKFIWLG